MTSFMTATPVSLGPRCVGGEEKRKGILAVCWTSFIQSIILLYVLWDGLIMTFFIKHVKACSVQCVLRLANEVIEPAGSVSLSFFSYDHIANNPVPPLL